MNVEEHEAKLRVLNQRFLEDNMTHEQVERELNHLLGQDDLSFRLREVLDREVNSRISWKARERLSTESYFLKRDELENQVIESGFLFPLFESATLNEVEALTPTFLSEKCLHLIVIKALCMYVDREDELNPKCKALHRLYLQLKQQLNREIPDYPQQDGFAEYLASVEERKELEQTRSTGSVCLKCGSHNIRSKGKEWQCRDCGKRFRKR